MNYDPELPSIADMRNKARKRIPRFAFEYLDSGIGAENCLQRNRTDLDKIKVWPRYLTDVTQVDTSCLLFGQQYDLGIGISPIGLGNMMWPNAERALAEAALKANIPYILSTMSTTPLEEIADIASDVAWFQLYVPRDEAVMEDMIRRAQAAKYKALVVTVDLPVGAKRDKELKNGLILPFKLTPKIVLQTMCRPTWSWLTLQQGIPQFVNLAAHSELDNITHLGDFLTKFFTSGVTTDRLKTIRKLWDGPLIVKGLQRQKDIEACQDLGIDGVIVSNHGGRQLDAAPSSIESLLTIADRLHNNVTVMFDSGIRSGLDVVKAKALGAKAVFSGRSFFYALGAAGQDGGRQAIEIFRDEITRTLQQVGCKKFEQLNQQWLEP